MRFMGWFRKEIPASPPVKVPLSTVEVFARCFTAYTSKGAFTIPYKKVDELKRGPENGTRVYYQESTGWAILGVSLDIGEHEKLKASLIHYWNTEK